MKLKIHKKLRIATSTQNLMLIKKSVNKNKVPLPLPAKLTGSYKKNISLSVLYSIRDFLFHIQVPD